MLTVAIRYADQGLYAPYVNGRNQPKVAGFQLNLLSFRAIKALVQDKIHIIPRSRIVDYHYVQLIDDIPIQDQYFLISVTEAQLPLIEAITKQEYMVQGIYLWRDGQWWAFPQKEQYETGKTLTRQVTMVAIFGGEQETREYQTPEYASRVRETYEPSDRPRFRLTSPIPSPASPTSSVVSPARDDEAINPAGYPVSITGNGMVLEWKRGYADKPECWWIRDEVRVSKAKSATYRHYETLKGTFRARWSKSFGAWYFTGGATPPQSWLDLVGYSPTGYAAAATPTPTTETSAPAPVSTAPTPPLVPAETPTERALRLARETRERFAAMREHQQFHAAWGLHRRYTEALHHLSAHVALPAVATPSIDDPWE